MRVNATPMVSFPYNATVGPYLRVMLTSGQLVVAGALDREIGVVPKRLLTSGLGSATSAAIVTPNAEGTVRMIAAGAISQYAKVYGAASGKVSATANGNYIGIALAATTADGDEVEVLRLSSESGLVYSNVAASAAVTNTTDETAFDKSVTIPANSLKAGDVLVIRAQAIATATNSTDTLTLKLKIGSTVIIATAAVDVANGDVGYVDCILIVRTIGATGTIVASGVQGLGVPGTVTAKPFLLASSVVDTTAALAITVTATWSVANAGNSCRLDCLTVHRLAA